MGVLNHFNEVKGRLQNAVFKIVGLPPLRYLGTPLGQLRGTAPYRQLCGYSIQTAVWVYHTDSCVGTPYRQLY